MKKRTWLIAALSGIIFVVTLILNLPTSESFEAVAPQVVQIGKMSVERAAHQASLLKSGQVLITGGCAGRCDFIHASTELYDPSTHSFRSVAPMSIPRASHAAVVLSDGRVLVCGGWTGQRVTASAEIYDPAADQWTAADDITEARASHIAVPLADGRVLIMGGGAGGLGDLASAEIFDPVTSTFSAVGRMLTNHYLATKLADGRVLVTGGQNDQGEILRSAEIFDPATNKFQPTGDMVTPRVKHAAALLTDGKVMIIGGSDERGYSGRFASTEFYDPTTGTFSPGPNLRSSRHKIRDAVVVLPNGAVLVAGGAVQPELFDPADRVFIPVEGELSGPQMFATATLLPTSEVLILGGYDEQTWSSAAAWLVRGKGSTGIKDENDLLDENNLLNDFLLYQNYPNPFNPTTEVEYQIPIPAEVKLVIYDIRGRKIRTFAHESQQAGVYKIQWDGRDDNGVAVSNGIYLYRMYTEHFSGARKLLLVR